MKNLVHIADSLKVAFIDFVLANFDDSVVIGHEVMYGSLGKFADIVLLYKGDTYAIEIKSDSDLSLYVGKYIDYFRNHQIKGKKSYLL